jgi:hypothetical protein
MSHDQYRGDSLQKNAARLQAYGKLSRQSLYHQYHIVIAGTCGDIHALIELGVPREHIIACDVLGSSRKLARAMGVIVPPGEAGEDIRACVAWAVEVYGKKIGSINVDLCMSMLGGVPILQEVTLHVQHLNCPIFFTCRRGRDKVIANKPGEAGIGKKREAFFWRHMSHMNAAEWINYQSWTKTSIGSAMSLAILS